MLAGYTARKYQLFEKFYDAKCKILLWGSLLFFYIILVLFQGKSNISIRVYGERPAFVSVVGFILMGVTGAFLCITLSRSLTKNVLGKLFSLIGKHTLPIMGFHVMLYHVICLFIKNQYHGIGYWLYVSFANFSIIFICIGLDLFVKRYISRNL